MQISVIIPTLNEIDNIGKLIDRIQQFSQGHLLEIIVVDSGSEDGTIEVAEAKQVKILKSLKKGRAPQMNAGAKKAKGEVLYFVHADTLPPECFTKCIEKAIQEDFSIGCFRYQFNSPRKILKVNAYFTRFKMLWCRGGDQSLFIRKDVFEVLEGFREDYVIMEDFEFIKRARKQYPFKIIPENMIVSARKYNENSYLRVQLANLIVFNMFRFGFSQEVMVRTYRKLLKQIKN